MWYKHSVTGEIANDPSVRNVTNASHAIRLEAGWEEYQEHEDTLQAERDKRIADHIAAVDAMQSEALAICQDAGINIPTSWDDGQTKLQALSDEMLALKAGLRFMKLRRKMDEVGVRWNEIVA